MTDPEDSTVPIIVGECAFFLLPFLAPDSLKKTPREGEPAELLTSQKALAEEAALRLNGALNRLSGNEIRYKVLGAHLFTRDSKEAGSERVFLGGAEQVDVGQFSGFNYIGLGHLHRCQPAGINAWYSGSPIAYSFKESPHKKCPIQTPFEDSEYGKFVLAPVLTEQGTEVSRIPIQPLRKLYSLSGTFDYFDTESGKALEPVKNDYLELVLDDITLQDNAMSRLRKHFPHLLTINQGKAFDVDRRLPEQESLYGEDVANRTVKEDFADFLIQLYGTSNPGFLSECERFDRTLEDIEKEEKNGLL